MDDFKVCPRCQHKSSAAKNYCDRCGAEFALQPPAGGPDVVIPQTLTMKIPPPSGQPPATEPPHLNLPQAGRSQQVFAASPPTQRTAAPAKTPSAKSGRTPISFSLFPSGLTYFLRSVISMLVLVFLGIGILLIGLQQLQARSPKAVVKRTAQHYLQLMATQDYLNAYDFLSGAAKAACSLDDFRSLQDTTPWTWSNARVALMEPDAAFVEYDLSQPPAPSRKDYMSFTLGSDGWSRPFNRGLVRDSRTALETGHPDMAYLKAQEAIRVDPRDPLARAMLCEASYARRQPDEIEQACDLALQTARKYPSALGAPALYRIYALLAETLHGVKRYAQAAEAYTAMLGFPRISDADVCRLSFARAEAYANLGLNAKAAADLERAATACANPADKAAALRQKSRLPPVGGR